jgi:hypothetical protein
MSYKSTNGVFSSSLTIDALNVRLPSGVEVDQKFQFRTTFQDLSIRI